MYSNIIVAHSSSEYSNLLAQYIEKNLAVKSVSVLNEPDRLKSAVTSKPRTLFVVHSELEDHIESIEWLVSSQGIHENILFFSHTSPTKKQEELIEASSSHFVKTESEDGMFEVIQSIQRIESNGETSFKTVERIRLILLYALFSLLMIIVAIAIWMFV